MRSSSDTHRRGLLGLREIGKNFCSIRTYGSIEESGKGNDGCTGVHDEGTVGKGRGKGNRIVGRDTDEPTSS